MPYGDSCHGDGCHGDSCHGGSCHEDSAMETAPWRHSHGDSDMETKPAVLLTNYSYQADKLLRNKRVSKNMVERVIKEDIQLWPLASTYTFTLPLFKLLITRLILWQWAPGICIAMISPQLLHYPALYHLIGVLSNSKTLKASDWKLALSTGETERREREMKPEQMRLYAPSGRILRGSGLETWSSISTVSAPASGQSSSQLDHPYTLGVNLIVKMLF